MAANMFTLRVADKDNPKIAFDVSFDKSAEEFVGMSTQEIHQSVDAYASELIQEGKFTEEEWKAYRDKLSLESLQTAGIAVKPLFPGNGQRILIGGERWGEFASVFGGAVEDAREKLKNRFGAELSEESLGMFSLQEEGEKLFLNASLKQGDGYYQELKFPLEFAKQATLDITPGNGNFLTTYAEVDKGAFTPEHLDALKRAVSEDLNPVSKLWHRLYGLYAGLGRDHSDAARAHAKTEFAAILAESRRLEGTKGLNIGAHLPHVKLMEYYGAEWEQDLSGKIDTMHDFKREIKPFLDRGISHHSEMPRRWLVPVARVLSGEAIQDIDGQAVTYQHWRNGETSVKGAADTLASKEGYFPYSSSKKKDQGSFATSSNISYFSPSSQKKGSSEGEKPAFSLTNS